MVSESKLALNPSGSKCPDVKASYSGGRSNVVSETSCEGMEKSSVVVSFVVVVVVMVMGL